VRDTPRTFLEGDNAANYDRAFREQAPADVEIVNSVVVDYAWRPGVVTTDDWEFELLASRDWIVGHVRSLGLATADAPPPEDEIRADIAARKPVTLVTAHWRDIYERKLHPIRTWYAPKPLAAYEIYYSGATSSSRPSVHMLVEPEPTAGPRHRVFVSKH